MCRLHAGADRIRPHRSKRPEETIIYTLNFHDLDPDIVWPCQGPRHTMRIPRAVALAMFLLTAELRAVPPRILVHQACYVCGNCRKTMLDDLKEEITHG